MDSYLVLPDTAFYLCNILLNRLVLGAGLKLFNGKGAGLSFGNRRIDLLTGILKNKILKS